jgi:peptide/nickel transport system substrate-binding protein
MSHRANVLAPLAALVVAACGSDESPARLAADEFCADAVAAMDAFTGQFPEPTGERYGGTVVAASYGPLAGGMNSLTAPDYSARQHQTFVSLMTLVRYDEELEFAPYLAESWELGADGALTFHLRDDVFWHDGERTTAHDVAFTYRRAADPATQFPNPSYWAKYAPGDAAVTVVDSFTVRFQLEPHLDYLDAWTSTAIMPAHLLADVPPPELAQHPFNTRCPVGNGPFVFVEHRQDDRWIFRRNPAFPAGLGGPPYLDRYVYRIVLDQSTLLAELLTENVDFYSAPDPDQSGSILEAEHLDLRSFPFRQYTSVAWNGRKPQLEDRRVRVALTMGVDRREIIDVLLQGYGDLANSSVPTFHWAYDPSLAPEMPYDPNAARRLLEAAGWIDRDGDGVRENESGVRLTVTVASNQGNAVRADLAQLVQASLGEIGVEVETRILEYQTMLSTVLDPTGRDFEGVVWGWVNDFRIDDTDLFHSRAVDGPYALSGTTNPELDMLLDTLQVILDRDEARPYWHRYQRVLMQEQPYSFLYFNRRLVGLNRRLQDVEVDVRGEWVNVGSWWIPSGARKYGSGGDR